MDSFTRFKERHIEQETRGDNTYRNNDIWNEHLKGTSHRIIAENVSEKQDKPITRQAIDQIIKKKEESIAKEAKSLENEGLKVNGQVSNYNMVLKRVIDKKSSIV